MKIKKRVERRRFGTVSLPYPLIEKIKERIDGTGFTSVGSYVEYVMRAIVEEKEEKAFTEKDKDRIKTRLKALGYIE